MVWWLVSMTLPYCLSHVFGAVQIHITIFEARVLRYLRYWGVIINTIADKFYLISRIKIRILLSQLPTLTAKVAILGVMHLDRIFYHIIWSCQIMIILNERI